MSIHFNSSIACDNLLNQIEQTFGEETRRGLLGWIFDSEFGRSSPVANSPKWSGVEHFKDRFLEAIGSNGQVSTEDSIYIWDLARRVNNNVVKVLEGSDGSKDYSQELPSSPKF